MREWLNLTEPMTYEEFLELCKNRERGDLVIQEDAQKPSSPFTVIDSWSKTRQPISTKSVMQLADSGLIHSRDHNIYNPINTYRPCISKG